jgi:hypothetical protein
LPSRETRVNINSPNSLPSRERSDRKRFSPNLSALRYSRRRSAVGGSGADPRSRMAVQGVSLRPRSAKPSLRALHQSRRARPRRAPPRARTSPRPADRAREVERLAERDEADPEVLQLVEERHQVPEIAAEAVEGRHRDQVELAATRIGHEGVEPGALLTGAAHRLIGELAGDLPGERGGEIEGERTRWGPGAVGRVGARGPRSGARRGGGCERRPPGPVTPVSWT